MLNRYLDSLMKKRNSLPIVVIGAGPIGLAAGAQLSLQNESFVILEAGARIADNVHQWQHVSMFSPWKYNIEAASAKILNTYGWEAPPATKLPTGKQLLEEYLLPLANTKELKPHIRLYSEVLSISRKRLNKLKDVGRETAPFVIHLRTEQGEERIEARAVIDASGTWQNPKPAGADGLPAIGEDTFQDRIRYGIPDIEGRERHRYEGKDVAVIGGGHSAINALLELAVLKTQSKEMNLHWILTKTHVEEVYGGLDQDELPGRGRIGQRIKELVEDGMVKVHTPFFVEEMRSQGDQIAILGQSLQKEEMIWANEIIVATGLKPNLEILRELRIAVDEKMESPIQLAPLIDPNIHRCGSVKPHGEAVLRHPEKDFYIVGMKSYGRAPTFLLATGYEQVRSVVAGLVGDWDAAKTLHLELPETGVCGPPHAVDPNMLEGAEDQQASCCKPDTHGSLVKRRTGKPSECC